MFRNCVFGSVIVTITNVVCCLLLSGPGEVALDVCGARGSGSAEGEDRGADGAHQPAGGRELDPALARHAGYAGAAGGPRAVLPAQRARLLGSCL